jgi:hypothetical protein
VAVREVDFDEPREQMPMLQDDATAQAIVNRAVDLCVGWGREDMVDIPELVRVIEMVALASLYKPGLPQPARPA